MLSRLLTNYRVHGAPVTSFTTFIFVALPLILFSYTLFSGQAYIAPDEQLTSTKIILVYATNLLLLLSAAYMTRGRVWAFITWCISLIAAIFIDSASLLSSIFILPIAGDLARLLLLSRKKSNIGGTPAIHSSQNDSKSTLHQVGSAAAMVVGTLGGLFGLGIILLSGLDSSREPGDGLIPLFGGGIIFFSITLFIRNIWLMLCAAVALAILLIYSLQF